MHGVLSPILIIFWDTVQYHESSYRTGGTTYEYIFFYNTAQLKLLYASIVAVDCSNGLGSMAYYGGLSAFKPTELATQSMVCVAGYRWSDGSTGSTVKIAVCTDVSGQYGFGIGQWISTDGTSCVGSYEQYELVYRFYY